MATRKRMKWLDMLRGFAMLCVIIGHPANVPKDIECWVYSFHMPLFFMISGVTFRYEKYDDLKSCVACQARKILLPYVLLYLVCIPFWYVNRVVFGSSNRSLTEVLLGILTANDDIITMSNGALWFLPTLFLTTVFYWILYDCEKKGNLLRMGTIAGCFLIGILVSSFLPISLPWRIQVIPMAVVFYHVGHVFGTWAQANSRWTKEYPNRTLALAIASIAIGTWAAFANGKISMAHTKFNIMILALISSCGISLGLALMFMNLPAIRPLEYVGKHSILFLGFHIPVMRFLENYPLTAVAANSHPLWTALVTVILLFPIVFVVDHVVSALSGRRRLKSA